MQSSLWRHDEEMKSRLIQNTSESSLSTIDVLVKMVLDLTEDTKIGIDFMSPIKHIPESWQHLQF